MIVVKAAYRLLICFFFACCCRNGETSYHRSKKQKSDLFRSNCHIDEPPFQVDTPSTFPPEASHKCKTRFFSRTMTTLRSREEITDIRRKGYNRDKILARPNYFCTSTSAESTSGGTEAPPSRSAAYCAEHWRISETNCCFADVKAQLVSKTAEPKVIKHCDKTLPNIKEKVVKF